MVSQNKVDRVAWPAHILCVKIYQYPNIYKFLEFDFFALSGLFTWDMNNQNLSTNK